MIFATNNNNKLKQIRALAGKKFKIFSLKDKHIDIDVEETGKTLEENAILKAKTIFDMLDEKECVMADDAGLFIDFFDGWPGVYTKRFLKDSTTEERNEAILEKMANVDDSLRGASMKCCLAFVDKNGKISTFEGVVRCKIAYSPCGDNLFGFDPIVVVRDNKTLAEFSDDDKVQFNHRSVAFKKFLDSVVDFESLD